MASTYKTPGVYVEEISLFPPSVAQVETAIPAFIGYTEKAEKSGESLTMKPTEIYSLLEFKEYFGGEYELESSDFAVTLDEGNNYALKSIALSTYYHLYDGLRSFFDNGGGKCYIVSVGSYTDAIIVGDESATPATGIRGGIKAVEAYDEPTMLVTPDAVRLSETELYSIQQMMIKQCADLQDRVAILDLHENFEGSTESTAIDWSDAVDNFRDAIGINNLKYAAAYTPWIYSSYTREIPFSLFSSTLKDSTATSIDPLILSNDSTVNGILTNVNTVLSDQAIITKTVEDYAAGINPNFSNLEDGYTQLKATLSSKSTKALVAAEFKNILDYVRNAIFNTTNGIQTWDALAYDKLAADFETAITDSSTGLASFANQFVSFEKKTDCINIYKEVDATRTGAGAVTTVYSLLTTSWLTGFNGGTGVGTDTDFGDTSGSSTAAQFKAAAISALGALDEIFTGILDFVENIENAASTYYTVNETLLFQRHPLLNNISNSIKLEFSKQPPSAAMAGVYAMVDNSRGVWKAPANVSLASVLGPVKIINDDLQKDLNVDTVAGKSINAIRKFTGKGTLVWGARTLDGNSKEWRYISVRRFYNMVEESVKKAAGNFVFEPNDANTWIKVKSMIENYLTLLWREGALAGAKAEHAFFVKIGLGVTMTSDDILNGIMNVEIGMAVVRPAEFIVLKFSHKMQES